MTVSDENVTHPNLPLAMQMLADVERAEGGRAEWLAGRVEPYVTIYACMAHLPLPLNLDAAIADMICDLLVLARQRGINPQGVIESAFGNYHSIEEEDGFTDEAEKREPAEESRQVPGPPSRKQPRRERR